MKVWIEDVYLENMKETVYKVMIKTDFDVYVTAEFNTLEDARAFRKALYKANSIS
jgi:hypothetical protein